MKFKEILCCSNDCSRCGSCRRARSSICRSCSRIHRVTDRSRPHGVYQLFYPSKISPCREVGCLAARLSFLSCHRWRACFRSEHLHKWQPITVCNRRRFGRNTVEQGHSGYVFSGPVPSNSPGSGKLFVLNSRGFWQPSTRNRSQVWIMQITSSSFSSAPTFSNGVIYTGGGGGYGKVYAVNAADGKLLWIHDGLLGGDNSSPAASDSTVYVSYACNQTYALKGHRR